MTRDEKQHLEEIKWQHSKDYGSPTNGCGTLNWVTGMGKTFATCKIISKVLNVNKGFGLILVPYEALVGQWENELKELNINLERVKVMTVQYYIYHSLRLSPIIVVFDELDEFYSSKRIKLIKKEGLSYKFAVGLTATFEEKRKRHLEVLKYLPIVSKIDEKEAVQNKWISNFIEFNLGVDLTPDELEKYTILSEKVGNNFAKFNNYEFAMTVLISYEAAVSLAISKGWRQDLDLGFEANREINNEWNPKVIIGYAKNLSEAVNERKQIIQLAKNKFITTISIVEKFKELKTILFSQSVPFANKIHLLLNEKFKEDCESDLLGKIKYEFCTLYHSYLVGQSVWDDKKQKFIKYGVKKLKERALELVKNNKSKVISTAKALDKGANVPSLELSITTSGSSSRNQRIQRAGRSKRYVNDEKKAIIINLYCKDTHEEKSLKESQMRSSNEIHWIKTIDEITLNPISHTIREVTGFTIN